MKKLIYLIIALMAGFSGAAMAQTLNRQLVCKSCVVDTTGGYISIFDTVKKNPICNYELLTKANLAIVHKLKLDRAKMSFFPASINKLYNGSGYSRGHVIPFEDLAWSQSSAKASMNLLRNLAPEPQDQNIGTELASENYERQLADSLGSVIVYAGTYGTIGTVKGINKPEAYWKVIITPNQWICFYMPTTGDNISYNDLEKCQIDYANLVRWIDLDPIKLIPYK